MQSNNLNMFYDIPLNVTVELGRNTMTIGDLLALGQGSIIELSKQAGEPLEVRANDKLIAHGEAVVVNDRFGVRLTDVESEQDGIPPTTPTASNNPLTDDLNI